MFMCKAQGKALCVCLCAYVSCNRPLELLPAAARCMSALCLAEAQALMAAAAEARGMSPGARRALHGGGCGGAQRGVSVWGRREMRLRCSAMEGGCGRAGA